MSALQLLGGIGLLVAGALVAVARFVAFVDAVYEGTRYAATPPEATAAWHGAIVAYLPGILAGIALGVVGAALLGWFRA